MRAAGFGVGGGGEWVCGGAGWEWKLAQEWAATLAAAGRDTEHIELEQWGKALFKGVQGRYAEELEAAIAMATRLLQWSKLNEQSRPTVLAYRGENAHPLRYSL